MGEDDTLVTEDLSGGYDPTTDNWAAWDAAANEYITTAHPELAREDASTVSTVGNALKSMGKTAFDKLAGAFTKADGSINWKSVAAAAGGLYGAYQTSQQQNQPKTGYQGSIPKYEAVREKVANTYDPERRPGSAAQAYFTGTKYVAPDKAAEARTAAKEEAAGLETLNKANPANQKRPILQATGTQF